MDDLTEDKAMLVLVRHGQSEWNFANRFIGWYDSPLTEEGEWEAEDAGRLLREHRIEVDEVHTSMLSRTLSTARLALEKMRKKGLSVPANNEFRSTWRLNERSYGALTGRNKKECTKEYGKEKLKLWRRSWDVPPPQYEDGGELYEAETRAFRAKVEALSAEGIYDRDADPPPAELPRGESLKDTTERLKPYWEQTLLPALQRGRRIMVFGHENNLRALVKLMDGIGDEEILSVDIPRAMPFVYFFERNHVIRSDGGIPRLKPIRLTPADAAEGSELLSARYLVSAELINAFHQRDVMNVYDTSVAENLEEVCIVGDLNEDSSTMCEVIGDYQHDFDDEDPDKHIVDGQEKALTGQTKIVDQRGAPVPASASGPAFAVPGAAVGRSRPAARSRPGGCAAGATAGSGGGGPPAEALGPTAGAFIGHTCAAFAAVAVGLLFAVHPRRGLRFRREISRRGSMVQLAQANKKFDQGYDLDDCAGEGCDAAGELQGALEEGAVGAEEEICELLGYDLGETLIAQIGRKFTEEERRTAYRSCGFEAAKSSAGQPQAVWLIGPSASGKSTLAPLVTAWVGITEEGYVTVDGEPFRDNHMGYQEALHEGKQRGCVWWGAYVNIRENVNKEKQRMLQAAVEESKHMVIPSTCLRQSQCVEVARMLLDNGYLIHIVGMYGSKEEIVARGQKRAKERGKRYDAREFGLALKQFRPMLELCNGTYRMICTTSRPGEFDTTDEGVGPLTSEQIQQICLQVNEKVGAGEVDVAA